MFNKAWCGALNSLTLSSICAIFNASKTTSSAMADEKLTLKIYGDPEKVIHYMDYTETPAVDNSSYIPDLVPGMLQPLEVYEDDSVSDEVLSNLDIEAIVKEAELSIGTPNVDSPNMEKQLK